MKQKNEHFSWKKILLITKSILPGTVTGKACTSQLLVQPKTRATPKLLPTSFASPEWMGELKKWPREKSTKAGMVLGSLGAKAAANATLLGVLSALKNNLVPVIRGISGREGSLQHRRHSSKGQQATQNNSVAIWPLEMLRAAEPCTLKISTTKKDRVGKKKEKKGKKLVYNKDYIL